MRELEELRFLGSFDVCKLLLLGRTDVVLLSLGLFLQQLFELAARLARFTIVALLFALLSIFLEQSQEVQHFAVR